jgi:hypothetical protein
VLIAECFMPPAELQWLQEVLMKSIRKAFATVVVGFAFAGPVNAESETFRVGVEATNMLSMSVINLRERSCGGESTEGNQDAKNAKFIGCVMYVLGVVDMLREWQKIDPTHALPVCVPRNVTSGALIIVVHDHIEATTPWRAT